MPPTRKPAPRSVRKVIIDPSVKSVGGSDDVRDMVRGVARLEKVSDVVATAAAQKAAIDKFVGVVTKALSDLLTNSVFSQASGSANSPLAGTVDASKKTMKRPAAKKPAIKSAAKKATARAVAKKAASKPAGKSAARLATSKHKEVIVDIGGETTSTGPGKKA